MFSAEKLIDNWTLKLRVPNPLPEHYYYIYYVPPKAGLQTEAPKNP